MSSVVLNLSRKWRSQNFDQIVGQDLAVRILKNSLYLGHYFPVYLFAGQRGCGKTSTARIFAAAVNCAALTSFQKDPKSFPVPCLVCESCVAMRDGNHPDFIEIDAASHTGVDNIRGIIESSTLLPLMGRKRVYLIDEAHMLSKAAFNAALKILEEPPATALFILATTNPHKIIDTVRSRCFQLFFTAIAHNPLKNHLATICKNEKIAYTDDALDLIVRHTQGSARDALNVLEQVRFSSSIVSKEAVLALLGHVDDHHVMDIVRFALKGSVADLMQLLSSLQIDQHKAEFLWQRMIVVLRALLWIKHGIKPHDLIVAIKILEDNARIFSLAEIHRMIELLYTHEESFTKTAMQHIFLEMILLDLCSKNNNGGNGNMGDGSPPCALGITTNDAIVSQDDEEYEEEQDEVIGADQQWLRFVNKTETINEPLLNSLFKQARFITCDDDKHVVSIELSKDFVLFKERLENGRALWQPLLQEFFSAQATLDMQFTGTHKIELNKKPKIETEVKEKLVMPASAIVRPQQQEVRKEQFRNSGRYSNVKPAVTAAMINKNEKPLDVSDEQVWKHATLLLRHFPGVITEMRENQ